MFQSRELSGLGSGSRADRAAAGQAARSGSRDLLVALSRTAPTRRRLSKRLLPKWRTTDSKTRIVFWCLLAAATLPALIMYAAIIGALLGQFAGNVNRLYLFWNWSKFIDTVVPAALIYDPQRLFAFVHDTISARAVSLPFAYPPSLLLLIAPLGWLRPPVAMLAWLGMSLAAYVGACWHRSWGIRIAAAAVVAPSTLAALYYGQVSLLVAALLIGGCRLAGMRPILAGVLFGLAAVKPQFGLLVPVALVSARQWRCIAAAAATTLLSIVVSGMIFGWATWLRLPAAILHLSDYIARNPQLARSDPTLAALLDVLGAPSVVADAAQFALAGGTAVVVWFCCRRGITPLATAALMVGAVLVTPYALFYDLPVTSYAVLAVIIEHHRSRDTFGSGELFIWVAVIALPALIVFNPVWPPWGVFILALFLASILRRYLRGSGYRSFLTPH